LTELTKWRRGTHLDEIGSGKALQQDDDRSVGQLVEHNGRRVATSLRLQLAASATLDTVNDGDCEIRRTVSAATATTSSAL